VETKQFKDVTNSRNNGSSYKSIVLTFIVVQASLKEGVGIFVDMDFIYFAN